VVLLLVDTLRADRLPFHGYPRETSPTLAGLAEESVVFERARAQAGCTFPSVASLLTSRPANEFMAGIDRHGMAVPEELPYLPAILRGRGYATAAVSASIVVRDTPSQINRQGGYGRGFEVFDESCLERSAACVNARTVPLLDRLPEPFFLYLHYLDPHAPYRPPSWHERRFARSRPERRWVRRGDPGPLFRTLYEGEPGGEIDRGELRHLGNLYDEEILFFDRQLAHLLTELRDRELLERTVLVLLSDHGEELLDHRHFGHCRNLAYETLLHTPLVMRLPGGRAAGRRSEPVDNLDLVPTLLDYLGLDPGGRGFAGRSLRPWLDGGDPPPERLHFALQGTVRTATDGRWKLLVDLESGRVSLYDLAADPGETRDLAPRRPREVQRLRRAVARWVEAVEGGDAAESVRRAREHERELEALGYL
jgi:arylsulfatase A-like enzyme